MGYNDKIIEAIRKGFEKDNEDKFTNCALVFAYNGTGKTRLSYDFAHYGRTEGAPQHTLYYNAYTEDLFTWDNDLDNNTEHKLLINTGSALIKGLAGYNFSELLRKYLEVFTDIDFDFHYDEKNPEIPDYVTFSKKIPFTQDLNGVVQTMDQVVENIKISRGEERLFVWCFFRCILDQVIGGNNAYKDIEYIFIDDPISSLDDNNIVAFAEQLYSVICDQLKSERDAQKAGRENIRHIKFVVSSHHALFFHIMVHGLGKDNKLGKYFLHRDRQSGEMLLKEMSSKTPFYYNVAMMSELQQAIKDDKIYTYHFNIIRSIIEKIVEFFGHFDYRYVLDGIKYKGYTFEEAAFSKEEMNALYASIVNTFSHQQSFFSPHEMNEDNKNALRSLFFHIRNKYHFILPDLTDERSEKAINQEKKAQKIQ